MRNHQPDQMKEFNDNDIVTFSKMKEVLLSGEHRFCTPVIAYMNDSFPVVQSMKLVNGVPLFIVKVGVPLCCAVHCNSFVKKSDNGVEEMVSI